MAEQTLQIVLSRAGVWRMKEVDCTNLWAACSSEAADCSLIRAEGSLMAEEGYMALAEGAYSP